MSGKFVDSEKQVVQMLRIHTGLYRELKVRPADCKTPNVRKLHVGGQAAIGL